MQCFFSLHAVVRAGLTTGRLGGGGGKGEEGVVNIHMKIETTLNASVSRRQKQASMSAVHQIPEFEKLKKSLPRNLLTTC